MTNSVSPELIYQINPLEGVSVVWALLGGKYHTVGDISFDVLNTLSSLCSSAITTRDTLQYWEYLQWRLQRGDLRIGYGGSDDRG